MKKSLFFSSLFSFFFGAPVLVFAAATISAAIPGMTNVTTSTPPGAYVSGFYDFALMIGGVLAFGAIVYGGVLYAISMGNPSRQSEGKEWIQSALIGLLLLAGATLILTTINPDLVNLTLPTLQTVNIQAPITGGGTGGAGTSVPGISGATSGLQAATMNALNDLEQACAQKTGEACNIYVTSGARPNAGNGTCTHTNGCKADIAPSDALNAYITSLPHPSTGATRGDGAALYQAPDGSIYANELTRPSNCGANCGWTGAHWDVATVNTAKP